MQAKLFFDFQTSRVDFNVDIKGGEVNDIVRKISLHQSKIPNLFIKHAHRILADPEEGHIHILHGNILRL